VGCRGTLTILPSLKKTAPRLLHFLRQIAIINFLLV
jgi:hypothetical protein